MSGNLLSPEERQAAVASVRFRLGPIQMWAELLDHDDPLVRVPATLLIYIKSFDRNSGAPADLVMRQAINGGTCYRDRPWLIRVVRTAMMRVWDHEFAEGFLVDGVRVEDPHAKDRF